MKTLDTLNLSEIWAKRLEALGHKDMTTLSKTEKRELLEESSKEYKAQFKNHFS